MRWYLTYYSEGLHTYCYILNKFTTKVLLFNLISSCKRSHANLLKSFTLLDLVSASKITRAARFWSMKTLIMFSLEQFDQAVDPHNIGRFIIAL